MAPQTLKLLGLAPVQQPFAAATAPGVRARRTITELRVGEGSSPRQRASPVSTRLRVRLVLTPNRCRASRAWRASKRP